VFEEGGFLSTPFHEGFGMMNVQGVPKPVYRAFELLHRTGTDRVSVSSPSTNTTTGVYVISNPQKAGEVMVVIYNHDIPSAPIKTEHVCVTLHGMNLLGWEATLERIDDTHSNPAATWRQMNSPTYINLQQVNELMKASMLVQENIQVTPTGGNTYVFQLDVPPQGVAVVTLSNQ